MSDAASSWLRWLALSSPGAATTTLVEISTKHVSRMVAVLKCGSTRFDIRPIKGVAPRFSAVTAFIPDLSHIAISFGSPNDSIDDALSVAGQARGAQHHLAIQQASVEPQKQAFVINPNLMPHSIRRIIGIETRPRTSVDSRPMFLKSASILNARDEIVASSLARGGIENRPISQQKIELAVFG